MKRTVIDQTEQKNSASTLSPWGLGGALWRYLVFLAALVAYLLLFQLAGSCSHSSSAVAPDEPISYDIPDDDNYVRDYINNPDGNVDPIGDQRNIDNPSPALPSPDDNRLIDVPDDEIITNPDDEYKQIVSTRLNVILNSDATDQTYNTFANKFKSLYPGSQYSINYYNALTKMMQLTVPADERVRIKENLPSQIPEVDFKIFYEEIFSGMAGAGDHNDPAFNNRSESWQFAPIQAFDAWEITKGSPDVVVAVIDSYIDVTHPELTGRIVKPYSVSRRNSNVLPPEGSTFTLDDDGTIYHGTHVATLAVGALDNNEGTAGIAPECSLMPISLGDQITSMKLIDATLYAIYQGADVINISIASAFPDGIDEFSLQEQMEYIMQEAREQEDVWDYIFDLANQRNCTIVWAAGNCNVLSGLDETKRNDTTLRVSAVDRDLNKSEYSNYGLYDRYNINYSDVSAPGTDIFSAVPGNKYGVCSGTSMAAPIVAGAVALMKSINPTLTNAEIIDILKRTGRKMPEDQHVGNLIQIRDALEAVNGEVANFDEIHENPDEIIGLWETTEQRTVVDSTTGDPTGEMCHIFLEFTSPTAGTIHYREDDGDDYSSRFTARFTDNRIYIDQTSPATAPNRDDSYVVNNIVCERGENGLLESFSAHNPQSRFFFIRRR